MTTPNQNNPLAQDQRYLAFADFRFDRTLNLLERHGQRIALPTRSAQVLGTLLEGRGEVVLREHIVDRIWRGQQLDVDANLNTAIRSIRRALGDDASNPVFVETLPGRGYRILAPVRSIDPSTSTTPLGRRGRAAHWIALAAVLGATAIGVALWRTKPSPPTADAHNVHYLSSPGYESMVRGEFANQRGDVRAAIRHFETAIDQDPTLAPAYVSLGRTHVGQRRFGWMKIRTAIDLADQALRIDSELVAAHRLRAGLALYYLRDRASAQRHIEQALAIAPHDADALVLNAYLSIVNGDQEAALRDIARAHAMRPLSPRLNADYGWILYKAGSWNDAERLCKASVELHDASSFALRCVIHVNHSQGDHAEAADFGLKLMAQQGASADRIDAIRHIDTPQLRERAFWDWMRQRLDLLSKTDVTDLVSLHAITLTMLGEHDAAMARFEQAYADNGEPFLAFLAVDPRVDALRSHPNFEHLAQLSRTPVPSH